ncbi:MAG: acyl-CoA thioesterase [Solirubrobacterales bacterium]
MGEPFRHRLRVRYHECDPQGVVFNANYLAYCDICLVELWREVVEGYAGMAAKGIDVVVAEARIRFLAPLRFDDEVEMSLTVASLGTSSMQLAIAIDRDGVTVAEAELAQVFIEIESGEKISIPDEIRAALETHLT